MGNLVNYDSVYLSIVEPNHLFLSSMPPAILRLTHTQREQAFADYSSTDQEGWRPRSTMPNTVTRLGFKICRQR